MRESELRAQRRITRDFIASNPNVRTLTLTPRERIKSGTGVRFAELPPRLPQTFSLIDQSSARGPVPGTVESADGKQRRVEFQLLGNWDAEVGLYDTWVESDGVRCEVAEILPFNGYEVRAQVVRYGT